MKNYIHIDVMVHKKKLSPISEEENDILMDAVIKLCEDKGYVLGGSMGLCDEDG